MKSTMEVGPTFSVLKSL